MKLLRLVLHASFSSSSSCSSSPPAAAFVLPEAE